MNILFIMCDSLPPQLLSMNGGPAGSSPNLDRLARRGVVFDRAYCNSPLCAPARASMVTGRYVSEIGAFDNASQFSSEWPTIGHAMRGAGHEPTIIGKMHFIGHDQSHGFERLAHEADYTTGYNARDYKMAYSWEQPPRGNPCGDDWMAPSYVDLPEWYHYPRHYDYDERTHREALAWLGDKGPQSSPFFACVSYHAPHNPFWIPEEFRARLRGADLPLPHIPEGVETCHGPMDEWLNKFHYVDEYRERLMSEDNLRWLYETFYGMLYHFDQQVGELLSTLETCGLSENTAVVFAADHGDMLAHRGMVQKRYFYERSVRLPLIFSFPGHWREGARVSTPVSLIDLFPTFAEMASVPVPDDLPGVSLMPSVVGTKELPDRTIFCEYHGEGVHAPCFMCVRGHYKYIYVHGHEERLYDLEDDPDEFRNLLCRDKGVPTQRVEAIAASMKQSILERFDPDAVADAAVQSQRNRGFIYKCVEGNRAPMSSV